MLKNKTILIVSPQSWGKMFLSKHHYARELAAYGNKVYFLNPPSQTGSKKVTINKEGKTDNLFIVDHSLSFPYNIKFHWIGLFHALMRFHVKKLLKAIGQPIDVVWSFDLGDLYPFKFFPQQSLKVFHPVDEPLNQTAIASARGADVVFSVTYEILDKYRQYKLPSHFINHGVSDKFIADSSAAKPRKPGQILVGLSGNFTRPDIDKDCLLQIITENPQVTFELWGSYEFRDSNIGSGAGMETPAFANKLKQAPNVVLHGAVPSDELAGALHNMDAFLICYDVQKDQSKGTNYHKIMEYVSTGKVIIANNVTTYKDRPDLVEMIQERDNNDQLPALFKRVITNLDQYNSADLQEKRRAFARDNTYRKQVEKIESILQGL